MTSKRLSIGLLLTLVAVIAIPTLTTDAFAHGDHSCDTSPETTILSVTPTADGAVVTWEQDELRVWSWGGHTCYPPTNGFIIESDSFSETVANTVFESTITGLECGTEYDVDVTADWSSISDTTDSDTYTTLACPAPEVVFTADSPTNDVPFEVTATWDLPMQNGGNQPKHFVLDDVTVDNGIASNFQKDSNTVWTFDVTNDDCEDGCDIDISIDANKAKSKGPYGALWNDASDTLTVEVLPGYVDDIDDAPLADNDHTFEFLDCDDDFATLEKARPYITSLVPTIDAMTVNWKQQVLDAHGDFLWFEDIHFGCFLPLYFTLSANGVETSIQYDFDNSEGTDVITGLACETNYEIIVTGKWISGAYGGQSIDSLPMSATTLACINTGGGGNDEWKTAPTFGIDWNTKAQIVEDGVTFNRNSYDVDDNFHTDFAKQPVIVGVSNIVAMKVYANYDLKWVEFIFDVPEVGAANNARATVFIPMTWMDTDEIDQDNVRVNQDVNLINADKVEVYRTSVTCTDEDVDENCDLIAAKVTFNEQPASGVFAFKAVDERNRSTLTYFNEGIEVLGESLNPLEVVLVSTPDRYHRGLVELTQVGDRYDNLWTSEDGYLYTMNSFGTFILVQAPDREARVDGGTPDRNHSAWDEVLNYEESKAKLYWNADLNKSELPPSFAYEFPVEDSRTIFLNAHDMLSFARGAN